ncbi:MAG: hypothetical protein JNL90_08595 [Planctomycetes bacterium]|nr:hypothetical protein [Planctomycetota bacterium]
MKSPLAAVSLALQLATLGLVVGLLVRRNDSTAESLAPITQRLERIGVGLDGALHRQAEIALFLDQLRRQGQAERAEGGAAPVGEPTAARAEGAAPGGPAGTPGPAASGADGKPPASPLDASPKTPFPLAMEALQRVKHAERSLREEIERDTRNVSPLETELKSARDLLIARGHEAVYVVRREVDLQPYEPERDVEFVEYLLKEVVPALSSAAKADAFDIARSALVRATNEPQLKFAGATALLQIDRERWSKDVIDVIKMGSANEVTLRGQLLGLFEANPRPEAVELSRSILEEARYAVELRTRALFVLAKQDSSAVNPVLRRALFEEPSQMIKNLAFDALWSRLEKSPAERRKLLEDVLAANPAQMPEAVQVKAQRLLDEIDKAGPK